MSRPRYSLLQRLQSIRESSLLGFAHEQMNVIRHHDVTVNAESKTSADTFECQLEDSSARIASEERPTMIAAEGNEVTLSAFVKTLQSPRHESNLRSPRKEVCEK